MKICVQEVQQMVIDEWVKHILKTDFDSFRTETVAWAKERIIDTVGCIIGGANAPGCMAIRDLVKEWDGSKQTTILGSNIKAPAYNVAMVNAIMGRSFDFGPIVPYIEGKPIISHISETTVPTAITVSEWKHASGKDLLTALILADDITARLIAASKYTPGVAWDCTGTVNRFGATAVAARLLGLDQHQLLHAFGIVLNQLSGSFQAIEDGTHSFKLSQGFSARDGIIAAELAAKGLTGCKDPLLGKLGYFGLYSPKFDLEILTKKLGVEFYADDIIKIYPCCGCMQAPIRASLILIQKYDIIADQIDEISIDICPVHINSPVSRPFVIGEFPQGNAIFNLRYNVANALARKGVKLEDFTTEFIRDPKVGKLAAKANVVANMSASKIWEAEVSVKMNDGRILSAHVDTMKGDPLEKRITKEEIEAKFRTNIAFSNIISRENAEKALNMLNELEAVEDVANIVQLLAK
jgi:2-methylcitrate dehydratase PrpD